MSPAVSVPLLSPGFVLIVCYNIPKGHHRCFPTASVSNSLIPCFLNKNEFARPSRLEALDQLPHIIASAIREEPDQAFSFNPACEFTRWPGKQPVMPAKKAKTSTQQKAGLATNTFKVPESDPPSNNNSRYSSISSSESASSPSQSSNLTLSIEESIRLLASHFDQLEATCGDLARRVQRLEERRCGGGGGITANCVPRHPGVQLILSGIFLLGIGVALPFWYGDHISTGMYVIWFTIWLVFLILANIGAVDVIAWRSWYGG